VLFSFSLGFCFSASFCFRLFRFLCFFPPLVSYCFSTYRCCFLRFFVSSLSRDRLFHGSPVLGIIALETAASTTMDQQQQKTATATSTRRAPTK
jgi:hypothetical protein